MAIPHPRRFAGAVMLMAGLCACRTITEPCEPVSFQFDGALIVDGAPDAGGFHGGTSPMSIGVSAYAAIDSTLFTETPGAAAVRLASFTGLGARGTGILTLALAAPLDQGRVYEIGGLTRERETAPHILRTGREAEAGLLLGEVDPDSVDGSVRVVRRDPLLLRIDFTFHFAALPPLHLTAPLNVIRRAGPLLCD